MKICVSCRKEMQCTKTGKSAVWHGSHVYRGDEYTCSECNAKIMVCNPQSYHDPKALNKEDDQPLNMTPEWEQL